MFLGPCEAAPESREKDKIHMSLDAPLPCTGIRCQKTTGQFKKGKASGLLLVKPLGDKMPYGTRQETAQKPENEGFQHQLWCWFGGILQQSH